MLADMAWATMSLWSFITTALGQIMFWGTVTVLVFMHTGYAYLVRMTSLIPVDTVYEKTLLYRLITATIIELFWIFNISWWMFASTDFMIYTDVLFTALSLYMWWRTRIPWLMVLTLLYFVTVYLDVQLLMGLNGEHFAWLSNGVYTLQLATVLGLISYLSNLLISSLVWIKRQIMIVFNQLLSSISLGKSAPY